MKGDQIGSDKDLYSLGVILMEVLTLRKVEVLKRIFEDYKSHDEQESQEAASRYGVEIVDFAKSLIFAPQSSKNAFKRFKDSVKTEYNSTERFEFRELECQNYDEGIPELNDFLRKIK